MLDFRSAVPFWELLDAAEQTQIASASNVRKYKKGDVIVRTDEGCLGAMVVLAGQIRTYMLSEEGRDITLYRLRKTDVCVLSASCLLDSITFDVIMEAIEDSEILIIPASTLHPMMAHNMALDLFFSKLANERFSDVMWTMQQILFLGVDRRAANFLWDEMIHSGSEQMNVTHEEVARYIGSAREVVTRIMKYFAEEGIVELGRGKIRILDKEKLKSHM